LVGLSGPAIGAPAFTAFTAAAASSTAATLAAAGTPLGQGSHHLTGFKTQLLALPAQIQGHEMAQVFQGHLAPKLQLEWNRPAAIGPGQLPHLDHQIAGFGPGVDQLAAD
jgi:hypothetical protein